jgi:hypothetical protein
MGDTRQYPDDYTYEWLLDLAANGEPVEPGYDGTVFVLPPQLLRVAIDGPEEAVIVTSVGRLPLKRLQAMAIDSQGNAVNLPAVDPSGEMPHSMGPTRTFVKDDRA